MALAILCSKLREDPSKYPPYEFRFHAFIVDHQAQSKSYAEAHLTARRLRSLGMQ